MTTTAKETWTIAYRVARMMRVKRNTGNQANSIWTAAVACGFKTRQNHNAYLVASQYYLHLEKFGDRRRTLVKRVGGWGSLSAGPPRAVPIAKLMLLKVFSKVRMSGGDLSLHRFLQAMSGAPPADILGLWSEFENPRTPGEICAPDPAHPKTSAATRRSRHDAKWMARPVPSASDGNRAAGSPSARKVRTEPR